MAIEISISEMLDAQPGLREDLATKVLAALAVLGSTGPLPCTCCTDSAGDAAATFAVHWHAFGEFL